MSQHKTAQEFVFWLAYIYYRLIMYVTAFLMQWYMQPPSPWPPLWMEDKQPVQGRWWPTPVPWSKEMFLSGLFHKARILYNSHFLHLRTQFLPAVIPHPLCSVLTLTIGPPSLMLGLYKVVLFETWPPPSDSLPVPGWKEQWWNAGQHFQLEIRCRAVLSMLQVNYTLSGAITNFWGPRTPGPRTPGPGTGDLRTWDPRIFSC